VSTMKLKIRGTRVRVHVFTTKPLHYNVFILESSLFILLDSIPKRLLLRLSFTDLEDPCLVIYIYEANTFCLLRLRLLLSFDARVKVSGWSKTYAKSPPISWLVFNA
jgi:hypothetical protein